METREGVEPKDEKDREIIEMSPLVESDPQPILPENHDAVEPKLSAISDGFTDGGDAPPPKNAKIYKFIVAGILAAFFIAVGGYLIGKNVSSGKGRLEKNFPNF